MNKFLPLLLIPIFMITCAFSSNPIVERGNVIYSFEGGKIRCQSEISPTKEINIMLSSLDKNTEVRFVKMIPTIEGYAIKALMLVTDTNSNCASWINMHEVTIDINPIPKNPLTFSGKPVYQSKKLKVFIK